MAKTMGFSVSPTENWEVWKGPKFRNVFMKKPLRLGIKDKNEHLQIFVQSSSKAIEGEGEDVKTAKRKLGGKMSPPGSGSPPPTFSAQKKFGNFKGKRRDGVVRFLFPFFSVCVGEL